MPISRFLFSSSKRTLFVKNGWPFHLSETNGANILYKQQDFLTLTGAARRARSEGYDITYHGLRNLVAAGYISHVPNGSRIYVFYPNVIRFLQKGLTAEQSLDYQLSRARN